MANLKGATYDKQIRDMNFKLFALGDKKGNDNLTHSNSMLTKRDMYIKDFAKHLQNHNIQGKLNQLLTQNHLNSFLEERLNGLSISTIENYLSGFNSLLKGFKEVNISHVVPDNYFSTKWNEIKEQSSNNIQAPRGLQSGSILNNLYNQRYESGVIGELMVNNGYRISEAIEIVKNPDNYIFQKANGDYIITEVIGKGGKVYIPKILNNDLYIKIKEVQDIPCKSTFHSDLKKLDTNLRAHDFRYSFAKNLYKTTIKEIGHKEALKVVSKELNHNRAEITAYYLSK